MNLFSSGRTPAWAQVLRPAPIALACALALSACGKEEAKTPQGTTSSSAPQIPVGVITATTSEVGVVTELPGRIEASRVAEVRARSAGIVQKRLFIEGSDVKAGQTLYRIDAAAYEASAQSARASLARAEANLTQTTTQLERFRPLVAANAISKQDFVNAESAQKQAQAEVAAAKAAVRSADITLGYASVTAPISGRIGQSLVTEGALVGQGEATPLAVIQQINPVYVNFTQSATEAFKLRKAMDEGKLKSVGQQAAQVHVMLDDGSTYENPGKLLFSDLSVDAGTGQVTLRAEIPNPKGLLLPGLYVRIRMEQAQASNAIAVPQQAVTRTENGDTVSVVSTDGQVSVRPVKVSMASGNRWVIQEGVQAGEQIMVDGFQKLQMLPPGTPVKAVPWTPASEAAPAQPSSAAAPAAAAQSAEAK
jgi:membrane fusion protein, multidrug efflux system